MSEVVLIIWYYSPVEKIKFTSLNKEFLKLIDKLVSYYF